MLRERLAGAINSFAGITPDTHQRKVEVYRLEADRLRENRQDRPWEKIYGESVLQLIKAGAGSFGAATLGLVGLNNLVSVAESADAPKAILGLALFALAVRLAKVPVRAMDSHDAASQVVNEELFFDQVTEIVRKIPYP